MDIENALAELEDNLSSAVQSIAAESMALEGGEAEKQAIEHKLIVDGKPVAKAKLISAYSRYRKKASSTDRLKRVQEIERYQAAQDVHTAVYDVDPQLLLIHDPVAMLVYCDQRLWLAIGEVNGI